MSKQTDLINIPDAITVSGSNVGIGTSTTSGWQTSPLIVGTGSGNNGLTVYSGSSNSGSIYFGRGTSGSDNRKGQVAYNHSNESMTFHTGVDERMRIDSSGQVGIGTDSPANLLHLKDEGYQLKIEDTSSGNTGEVLVSDTSLYFFSDRSNAKANSDIRFSVDNSEAMRIDSSGNLLVGRTTLSGTDNTQGAYIFNEGAFVAQRSSNIALYLNRYGTDGDIVSLRKDGTTVGSIGTKSDDLVIHSSTTNHVGLSFGYGNVIPTNNYGTTSNNTVDLGSTSRRFKDFYLDGGVYLGGTGSANKLDDYEEGTFTPTLGATGSNPSSTVNGAEGHYVKVGSLVMFRLHMSNTNISGGSGYPRVTGLPFSTITSANWSSITLGYRTSSGGVIPAAAMMPNNSNTIRLWKHQTTSSQSGTNSDLNLTDIGSSVDFYMAGTFYTYQ